MESSQKHLAGVLLILTSTAFFAIAGVFTKMVSADAWVIAGWRGLVGSVLISAYVFWRHRRESRPLQLRLDGRGWFLVVIGALASALFIVSLKNTYVANVAVIYATAPFMAAPIAWFVLRERVTTVMIVASALSLVGVAVTVSAGLGGARLAGDLLAVVMTMMFAIYVVAIKAFRDTPVQWAAALSAFVLFLASWIMSDPLSISARDLMLCSLFGFTFATAMMLMAEGAKMIPIAETALIGTLDVPFAIGFAWLLIGEIPPWHSMIGAVVVVTAVGLQAVADRYLERRKARLA
ncbi:MAG: DMT family transporter [Rhizobiaceae bacterium]